MKKMILIVISILLYSCTVQTNEPPTTNDPLQFKLKPLEIIAIKEALISNISAFQEVEINYNNDSFTLTLSKGPQPFKALFDYSSNFFYETSFTDLEFDYTENERIKYATLESKFIYDLNSLYDSHIFSVLTYDDGKKLDIYFDQNTGEIKSQLSHKKAEISDSLTKALIINYVQQWSQLGTLHHYLATTGTKITSIIKDILIHPEDFIYVSSYTKSDGTIDLYPCNQPALSLSVIINDDAPKNNNSLDAIYQLFFLTLVLDTEIQELSEIPTYKFLEWLNYVGDPNLHCSSNDCKFDLGNMGIYRQDNYSIQFNTLSITNVNRIIEESIPSLQPLTIETTKTIENGIKQDASIQKFLATSAMTDYTVLQNYLHIEEKEDNTYIVTPYSIINNNYSDSYNQSYLVKNIDQYFPYPIHLGEEYELECLQSLEPTLKSFEIKVSQNEDTKDYSIISMKSIND